MSKAQRKQESFARAAESREGMVQRLLDLVAQIPEPREGQAAVPAERARELTRKAAVKSAATAGTLAIPVGPLGWLTIAPELYATWKIQAQLVSDIAGAYGKRDLLSREQMLYCLFSHTSAKAFQDIVVRVGERYLIRRAPLSVLVAIANKIALRIAQRSAGRMITRWVPAVGALGVAGFVYVDTGKVADNSIDFFERDVKIEGSVETATVNPSPAPAKSTAKARASAAKAASTSTGTAGSSESKKPSVSKPAAKNPAVKKSAAKKSGSASSTSGKTDAGSVSAGRVKPASSRGSASKG